MAETITIDIDDSQLRMVDMQLALIVEKTQKTFGGGKRLDRVLPSINRDLRLILGQLPGMRQFMQFYFAFGLRPERGLAYYKKFLQEGNPALMINVYLILIATTIRLLQTMKRYREEINREQKRYEMMVRRARGWTQKEFVKGTKEWENYLRGMPS